MRESGYLVIGARVIPIIVCFLGNQFGRESGSAVIMGGGTGVDGGDGDNVVTMTGLSPESRKSE